MIPPLVCAIVILICTIFSIFFSSADMVYSTVNIDKLKEKADSGSKAGEIAYNTAKNYEYTIASILFGNNVANIFASSMVTILGTSWNSSWGSTVATIVFTIVLIIIAEFLPKAFSKYYNYQLALIYAYPLLVIKIITFPLVYPISKLFKFIGKAFEKKSKEEDIVDDSLLEQMVDVMEDEGNLDKDEAELVKSAIDLSDVQAYEIMTPRVEVYAIEIHEDIKDVLKDEKLYRHSRIPLYDGSIDNIVGVVPLKAIAKMSFKGDIIDLVALSYQPLVIPRNRQLLDLLDDFRKTKIHIAIVKDEYGGTEGIVTMEDILEEIVGDIFDETDVVEERFINKGNGKYLVDGLMNIDDFFELINYKEDFETDYATVGGLCQEILDRFALEGDEFMFADRYKFKIKEADKYTVDKILVTDTKFIKEEESNKVDI